MAEQGRVSSSLLAAPLAALAVPFIGGIACESILQWHGATYAAAAGLLLAAWLLLRAVDRWLILRLVMLAALAFVVGGWRMALDRHALEPHHVAELLAGGPRIVEARGEVQTRPVLHSRVFADFPNGWQRDPSSSFVVQLSAFRAGQDDWQPVTGLVRVRCEGPALAIEPGQPFEQTGMLEPLRPIHNPGEQDYRKAGIDERIFASLRLKLDAVTSQLPSGAISWLDRLRLAAHGLLFDQAEPLNGEDQALLGGLVLGRRDDSAGPISEPFLRTGTYHYLAINGLHMTVLAGVTWLLLRLAHVRPRWAAGVVLAMVTCYCLMAEPRPPILRAGLMIGLVCLGQIVARRSSTLNLLAAAAILLLTICPGELFRAGFQLSFTVVLGLVLFTGPVYRALYGWIAGRVPAMDFADRPDPAGSTDQPVPLTNPPAAIGRAAWWSEHPLAEHLLRVILQMLAVSAVAWIVGWPLTAYYYHRFYPWSVLCAMVLWLPVWAALSLSFVKMMLAAFIPGVAAWLNGPLHSACQVMLAAVRALDKMPGVSVTVGRPGAASIVAFYVFVLCWKFRPRWLSIRWMIVLGLVLAATLPLATPRRVAGLEVTTLDVGDGLCQVVATPDGQRLMFDCGSDSETDVAEQVVVPFLADRCDWHEPMGVDAGFVSHGHTDHYNGYPGLARRGLIDWLGVSPSVLPEWAATQSGAVSYGVSRLQKLLAEQRVRVRHVGAGAKFRCGEMQAELIWPPAWADRVTWDRALNDTSQTVRLTYAGRSMLLTGDLSAFTKNRLMAGAAEGLVDLHADVLGMPHHGEIGRSPVEVASTSEFIDAVHPSLVIISRGSRYERIIARCPALRVPGRTVLITGQVGAVTVRISPAGELTYEATAPQ